MTIDPGRLQRAIWLEAKLIDISTYRVRGGTADHMVEIVDGRCYCDCIDAQVRGDGCKHALLVRLLGGDKGVVRALRALVPSPTDRSTEHRTSRPHPESPNSGGTGLIPAKRVPTLTQERRNAGPTAGWLHDARRVGDEVIVIDEFERFSWGKLIGLETT